MRPYLEILLGALAILAIPFTYALLLHAIA